MPRPSNIKRRATRAKPRRPRTVTSTVRKRLDLHQAQIELLQRDAHGFRKDLRVMQVGQDGLLLKVGELGTRMDGVVDQVDEIVKRAEVRFKTAHEALTRVVSTLESNVAYLTRIVAGLGEKFEKFGAVLEGCSLFKADSPKEGSEGAPKSGESTE